MGLFSFIKNAGEKLFGGNKEVEEKVAAAQTNEAAKPDLDALNAKAADAIKKYIETQNLGINNLSVDFDAAQGKVLVTGEAPSQEAKEKVTLCCGNVEAVAAVDNQIIAPAAPEAQYHDVERGDTLSAIAKKYYGNANAYMVIFEANKPMLSHPDKIYPGQKLRIPASATA